MSTNDPDPTPSPQRRPSGVIAEAIRNLSTLVAIGLIVYDAVTKPPGIDSSTLAAAAVIAAIAQGIEGALETILERVLPRKDDDP